MVLDIWNERVSGVRQYYKFARTVVLVKGKNHDEFLIFEVETIRYDFDLYHFGWNSRGNLEGFAKADNKHKFTWQPHGSQFTIIEPIPQNRLHIKLKTPPKLSQEEVLKAIHFDDTWFSVISQD